MNQRKTGALHPRVRLATMLVVSAALGVVGCRTVEPLGVSMDATERAMAVPVWRQDMRPSPDSGPFVSVHSVTRLEDGSTLVVSRMGNAIVALRYDSGRPTPLDGERVRMAGATRRRLCRIVLRHGAFPVGAGSR